MNKSSYIVINKELSRELIQIRANYNKLLGEYQGFLEGLLWYESSLSDSAKVTLSGKIEALKKLDTL